MRKTYTLAGLYFFSDWETKQELIEKAKVMRDEDEITYKEALEMVADELGIPCSYSNPNIKPSSCIKEVSE